MSAHTGSTTHIAPGRREAAVTVDATVGTRVGQLRRRHDWSQAELAEELRKIGWDVDRTVVAKIEGGSRKVSLENLLALAVALGVEPVALMLPRDDQQEVAVAPNVFAQAWEIRAWFHGYQHLGNYAPEERPDAARFYAESMSDQEWAARRYPQVMALRAGYMGLELATAQADPEAMRAHLRQIVKDAEGVLAALDPDSEENRQFVAETINAPLGTQVRDRDTEGKK